MVPMGWDEGLGHAINAMEPWGTKPQGQQRQNGGGWVGCMNFPEFRAFPG